jgi:hypothetical protein
MPQMPKTDTLEAATSLTHNGNILKLESIDSQLFSESGKNNAPSEFVLIVTVG